MKQLVVLMLVAALAVPALAEVAVTAADNGGGELLITVTPSNGAVVRGVALALTRTAGDGQVLAAGDVVTTNLNTFIDYGFSVPAGFDVNVGHAAADIAAAGVATFPATNLSLCAGYLDTTGAQAGQTGVITFKVTYDATADTTIGIALDTLRGGIVGDTLGAVTVQASQTLVMAAPVCLGDFNNDGAVNGSDVPGLIATFNKVLGQAGYNPLGDFNGDNAVNGSDIPGFINVFNKLCP